MATTYTWSVTNLWTIDASATETNYVVMAAYLVIGTDGTYSAELSNIAQFEVKTDQPDYIPYADLTESKVLEWIYASLGEDGMNNLAACIQGQIDSQANPPVSPEQQLLPWVNS